MKRQRISEPMLIWSSEWPYLPTKNLSLERQRQQYLLHLSLDEELSSEVVTVYDKREPLLNTKHQEITNLPHEIRGETIKKLKGRGFIKIVSSKLLQPVDIDFQCCCIIAQYYHQKPQFSLQEGFFFHRSHIWLLFFILHFLPGNIDLLGFILYCEAMSKRILTGIQPTDSQFHIGNYFGAVKPLLDLAEQFPDAEIFLFLAIMHTFTRLKDGAQIRQNAISMLKLYAACGADLRRFNIYNPADIAGHAQLNWVLTCTTIMGTMERMHSYKEALDKGKAGEISVGTFCYPILMAADILLYDADIVPVGKDQKQHVEYARDIAQKFNKAYGETFKIPDVYIRPEVAIVPGIDGRKMSKSYNNYIGLLDDEKTILKKVKQIPTDTKTVEESKDPDTCNVYNMCKLFLTAEEDQALRNRYTAGGLSYKDAKEYLYEKIMAFIAPIQKRYAEIDEQEIVDMIHENGKRVDEISQKKIQEVYKKVGFTL